jgi:hypothetical protein
MELASYRLYLLKLSENNHTKRLKKIRLAWQVNKVQFLTRNTTLIVLNDENRMSSPDRRKDPKPK